MLALLLACLLSCDWPRRCLHSYPSRFGVLCWFGIRNRCHSSLDICIPTKACTSGLLLVSCISSKRLSQDLFRPNSSSPDRTRQWNDKHSVPHKLSGQLQSSVIRLLTLHKKARFLCLYSCSEPTTFASFLFSIFTSRLLDLYTRLSPVSDRPTLDYASFLHQHAASSSTDYFSAHQLDQLGCEE